MWYNDFFRLDVNKVLTILRLSFLNWMFLYLRSGAGTVISLVQSALRYDYTLPSSESLLDHLIFRF